jgi:hypothetical protein
VRTLQPGTGKRKTKSKNKNKKLFTSRKKKKKTFLLLGKGQGYVLDPDNQRLPTSEGNILFFSLRDIIPGEDWQSNQ